MVKSVCDESGDGTIKLTASEEWTVAINWFFAYWYKFWKIRKWSNFFWMWKVKNGFCQSGPGTLKLTLFQKWTDDSGKLKVNSMIFGWVW